MGQTTVLGITHGVLFFGVGKDPFNGLFKVKKGKDGRSISIYPQGTRKRKKRTVSNAEIAFINEYGAPTRGIAARPALLTAAAKKEKEAVDAGERVYHAYLNSKNL